MDVTGSVQVWGHMDSRVGEREEALTSDLPFVTALMSQHSDAPWCAPSIGSAWGAKGAGGGGWGGGGGGVVCGLAVGAGMVAAARSAPGFSPFLGSGGGEKGGGAGIWGARG